MFITSARRSRRLPKRVFLAGIMPIGPMNQVVMLTTYIDPRETFIAIPNEDVVYGLGWLSLAKEPVVLQVPDFGKRFWTFPVYDLRTTEISELGLQYGTKPGFYMVVGPDWKGETPAGIAGVVRSTTEFAVAMPRIFMDDTAEDHAAIQPALSQIQYYPLSQFDGKMKTKDWNKLPHFPVPEEKVRPEYSTKQPPWVDPAVFFEQLPTVMKQVPPMPGEEALYKWIGSILDAAAKDPEVMATLKETAFAADKEIVAPMMQWRYNGQPAGNGWTSESNNAAFGTDYFHRMGAVKVYPYSNRRNETVYLYTSDDTQGQPLVGESSYTVTFPKGQLPPTKGFWSLTVVQPRTLLLPERVEPLRDWHQKQDAEVRRRRQPDYLSREQIARQREGIQLAAGADWRLFNLDPRLLARPSHARRHLEAAGDQEDEIAAGATRSSDWKHDLRNSSHRTLKPKVTTEPYVKETK